MTAPCGSPAEANRPMACASSPVKKAEPNKGLRWTCHWLTFPLLQNPERAGLRPARLWSCRQCLDEGHASETQAVRHALEYLSLTFAIPVPFKTETVAAMGTDTRRMSRIGINAVATLVEGSWCCGWQEYAAQNDDAIDGLILMRRGTSRPRDTGGIVFVQVKCGARNDQKQYPDHICLQLGKPYVEAHLPRWRRVPGPAVLIYVDGSASQDIPPAWWVDLRSDNVLSPSSEGVVLIPKCQKFSHHTKGDFHRLCGPGGSDRGIEQMELSRDECLIPRLGKAESLRNDAWEFYKRWRADTASRTNPVIGEVLVNRTGWKHITRQRRNAERIVQSWMLLGAAKTMLQRSNKVYELGRARRTSFADGNILVEDYLGLKANVAFPFRQRSLVMVVLKRHRLLSPSQSTEKAKIWFYSVYELRRGALGVV